LIRMEIRLSREPTLYRARYLVPIIEKPLENGALITVEGRIIDVGPYEEVKRGHLGPEQDLGEVALLPAFVNAHTHLELSALKWRLTPSGSFVSWVKNLLRIRGSIRPEEFVKTAQEALKAMWHEGIGLLGDHGNTGLSISLLRESPFTAVFFREVIDFQGKSPLKDYLKDHLDDPKITFSLAPHAPYTVSPLLLQAIKAWTKKYNLPFSLHVAESPEEVEFLLTGEGPIRELLEGRGQWSSSFVAPGLRPVFYLDRLGILDGDTICVHLSQASEEELTLLAERRARPCICLRSNTFLGVGVPRLPLMLELGLKPCLGTDSLASNDKLSILAEMATVHRFFPEISPEIILKMATLWGAEALKQKGAGYIAPGARADLLICPIPEGLPSKELFSFLITQPAEQLGRLYG